MDDRLKRKEEDTARTISWKIMLESAQEAVRNEDFVQAEKLFNRALQTAEKRLGEDDILVAHILMEIADYHLQRTNTAKAQECYTRVRKILASQAVEHPAYSA
jgi:thioredoxin-like negative regulator of GroEL